MSLWVRIPLSDVMRFEPIIVKKSTQPNFCGVQLGTTWRSVNNVNRILNFIIQYYYMLRLCLKPILYINSIIFIILIDYIITIKFFG